MYAARPFPTAMTPLFAVSVHDIDAGGLARSFELPLAWLQGALAETDLSAESPGHADVRLSKTGSDVIVRGKVTATLGQPCARCLRPTYIDVEGELSLLLRPARAEATPRHAHAAPKEGRAPGGRSPAASGKEAHHDRHAHGRQPAHGNGRRPREDDEYEFSSEEADQDVYEGEIVVLDDFLREALLLEVPSFPLCSEDCPGIRPAPKGAPRSEGIDPRLSPLRALKSRLKLAASAAEQGAPEGAPAGAAAPDQAEGEGALPPGSPVRPRSPARPRIHAHRTAGSIGARAGSKKSRAKNSPSKKAR